ncbi:MAG: sigma-70 family RNA polymerase sigma factor, partial [Phycisphaerales bacterium]|nr:sigma-70 family RNA polymerase sigma factor [Hyphomonadaceae bacterium]
MTPDDETRLIAAARRGDSRAYAALVDAHQQAVRGFLRRFTGVWADADDIAQEAFVTAWIKLARFEGRSSFRSWVSGIGFRIARDARRAHGRASARDAAFQSMQEDVEAGAPLA